MRTFTFNTDLLTPKANLVKSVSLPLSPQTIPEFTFGETFSCQIFLVTSAGAYDSNSGNSSNTPKIGIGTPGAVPTSGTFTVSFGGQTSGAIAYNASASVIQTALQAMSSIGTNNMLVSGQFPDYDLQFAGSLGLASQTLMTSTVNNTLYPNSTVTIKREQAGTGSVNEIQSLSIQQNPVVAVTSFSAVTQTTNSGYPTGGTYTLSFAGYTTSGLAYNATASTIQTALQGLTSIGSGNALVTGTFPTFSVQFAATLGLAPQPNITAASSLTPTSAVTIATTQVGSATQNAVQSIALNATTSTNIGWSATIGLTSAQLQELIGSQQFIFTTMEFQYTDGSSNITVFGSPTIKINNRITIS
jgi:hypothetical protein